MPASVHKILVHGTEIFKNFGLFQLENWQRNPLNPEIRILGNTDYITPENFAEKQPTSILNTV